jgi:ribonuclease P protein component
MRRLAKAMVIKKSAEFTEIIQGGRRFSSTFFTISYQSHDSLRLGLTSSRTHSAVKRNYLKRVLRELARSCADLAALQGRIIIIIKESVCRASFAAVKRDFESLIRQVAEKKKVHD